MSIWTSDMGWRPGRMWRAGLALALATGLAACMGEGTGNEFGFLAPKPAGGTAAQATPKPVKVLHRADLAGGRVVVAGPRGYCLDRKALKQRTNGGFALLAACEVLSGGSGPAVEPVVMTVQVQPKLLTQEAPDAATLAGVLAPAKVLSREDGDGVSLVHVGEGGDLALPAGDPKYWRGAMVINGHLVGLALYAPKGSAMAGPGGRAMILALAEALREASPVKDYAHLAPVQAAESAGAAGASAAPKPGQKRGLGKLFPKLFQ